MTAVRVAAGLALLLAAHPGWTQQTNLTRTVGVTIAPHSHSSVRMLNLPKGTRLALVMRAGAPLRAIVLDEPGYRRFPDEADALLTARVPTALSFGVQLPESGTYYLVVDNRANAAPNRVEIRLQATPPAGVKVPVDPKPQLQQY